MALLITKCPHCESDAVSMASVAVVAQSNVHTTGLFVCPICARPVGAWLANKGQGIEARTLNSYPGTFESAQWGVRELWPAVIAKSAPDDVPPAVSRNFIQAEEAASRAHLEAAGMAYRRTLELALKIIAPELKGTLEKRIDKLTDDGRLTGDVGSWAHSIRDLGNEATHEPDEPTLDDVKELAAFTRVVLEYLFTMPAKVQRRASLKSS